MLLLEMQTALSVLISRPPQAVSVTWFQEAMRLSDYDFRSRYHSFEYLLQACNNYCQQLLRMELELIRQLNSHAVHQLFGSLVALQRPENQKRQRYLQLIQFYQPALARQTKVALGKILQNHFRYLIIQAKKAALIQPKISASVLAWQIVSQHQILIQARLQGMSNEHWWQVVVLHLWPIVEECFTPAGGQLFIPHQVTME